MFSSSDSSPKHGRGVRIRPGLGEPLRNGPFNPVSLTSLCNSLTALAAPRCEVLPVLSHYRLHTAAFPTSYCKHSSSECVRLQINGCEGMKEFRFISNSSLPLLLLTEDQRRNI
ncbi:hypothetical protein AOLI_G00103010 [Acnodon oligacanthus]